jgi:hypothetical protein
MSIINGIEIDGNIHLRANDVINFARKCALDATNEHKKAAYKYFADELERVAKG